MGSNFNEDPEQVRQSSSRDANHFGDEDFEVEEDYGEATWAEVFSTCCVHTSEEWGYIALGILACCFFLYFFLFGLELLGSAAKVITGCTAGELFGDDTNPVAGLMIGILATVLLQSSSTTTSIVVSLVGSAVSTRQGIYIIMGANIGTSVTNTIVAMGQMNDIDMLERAFAGATVHDIFNFSSVFILLPIEVITGYLYYLTKAMVRGVSTEDGDSWEGPVKVMVSPLRKRILIANKDLVKAIATGESSCATNDGFYPMNCTEDTYAGCDGNFGLIACDKKSGDCPAFFQSDATAKDDKVSGGCILFLSIVILFTCLIGLISVLQYLLLGMSTRIVYKATDINGYLAILIGAGITVLVQSSSISTSTLTPLVGLGAIRLEQMYPLTLGANVGTTVTAIMSAMVTEGTGSLQVALAHLFFNLSGIAIFYPIPFMRNIPISLARRLGKTTRVWRGFPFLYIVVVFFIFPLLLLGLSALFEKGTLGFTVTGSVLVIILFLALAYTLYWLRFRDGTKKCASCMARKERRRVTNRDLPDDMDYLKEQVEKLIAHTDMPVEDFDDDSSQALSDMAP